MQIVKRSGLKEAVKFDKITKRIQRQCKDLKNVDSISIAQKVVQGIYDGVTSTLLDELAIETAYSYSVRHPEYDKLALRLAISALHKETPNTFSAAMGLLQSVKDSAGRPRPVLDDKVYKFIQKNAHILDAAIVSDRDFLFDYFGYKTLSRSYLQKIDRKIVERPQYMWMRVACGIHLNDIEAAIETYNMMSLLKATHATPSLFNSGTVKNQMSSCFLVQNKEDSIDGIYSTLKDIALISQSAGGIGLSVHDVRSKGSPIYGTGGTSNGLIPMLKVFAETANYVDQGGGRRKGSIATYIEPTHPDIFDFLDLRKNNGKEELRARNLNLAIWASDLFFEAVQSNGDWYLFDPAKCPGLSEVWGDEYRQLFNEYVEKSMYEKKIKAQDLWSKIIESQIETGQPYLAAKDAGNRKSNQNNLGTIKQSNLCIEIFQYTSPEEIAVCNLASISLPSFVQKDAGTLDWEGLAETTKILVRNLNKVIDINYYPVKEAKYSNLLHRPIGIGIQGLADVFFMLKLNWDSDEAMDISRKISECMYFAGIEESCSLSAKTGPYESWEGCPASRGDLQPDLWGVNEYKLIPAEKWSELKERVKKYGLRNSLLFAQMPTASTSQILGNTESFEMMTSNIYKRQTLSGEFTQVNKHLVNDLMEKKLWSEEIRNKIILHDGSVQSIPEIPDDIKKLYRTVWEMSQRVLIDHSAVRAPYVCQSQSLNLYFKDPTAAKLSSAYMYGWKKGLKTIVYYTRTSAAREAIKFTVDSSDKTNTSNVIKNGEDGGDECIMCSS